MGGGLNEVLYPRLTRGRRRGGRTPQARAGGREVGIDAALQLICDARSPPPRPPLPSLAPPSRAGRARAPVSGQYGKRDETRPVSTGRGTRRVQLVREPPPAPHCCTLTAPPPPPGRGAARGVCEGGPSQTIGAPLLRSEALTPHFIVKMD